MLLGIIVNDREVAVIDVFWDGEEFLVPLASFRQFCECDATRTEAGVRVVTPIGTATLGVEQLVERMAMTYLRGEALGRHLAMPYEYDAARMALVIDIPWAGMRENTEQRFDLTPDVTAPELAVSYAATSGLLIHEPGRNNASGSALLMGRFAAGQWRARVSQSLSRQPGLEEYGWTRSLGDRSLLLLGHQRLDLHPLLEPLELLGAQAAWTNAPLAVFGQGRVAGELLPRQLSTRTTISGQGVPAGVAVLRIDDRRVASTVIDLGGYYEFTGVQIPAGGRRVEVLIYDRQNPAVPVEIQEHTQRASDALLPVGAAVVQGAMGEAGNPLGASLTGGQGLSGFAQARYGLAPGFTVESTVQQGRNGTSLIAGAVKQIGRGFVASATGGFSGGALGYQAEIDGDLPGWRVRLRSMSQGDGYRFAGSSPQEDHYLELSRQFGAGLEVGILGRRQAAFGSSVEFLLPALSWRPDPRFMVRARPDSLGRYRFDLNWLPDGSWRAGLTRSGRITTGTLSRQVSRSLRAQVFAEFDDLGGSRQAAVLGWVGGGRYSPALSGGPLLTNGRPGVVLSAQAEVVPGVLLGVRYESSSLASMPFDGQDYRLAVTFSTRHAVAGGRLMAAGAPAGTRRTGGIAGRIRVPDSYDLDPEQLRNMTIRLNGRGVARTRRNGSFYVSNLEPGVYRVEFDADRLPIELSPRERSIVVEVAAGSVTDVQFHTDVEFGMAGRVRIGAANAPGVVLEAVDVTGTVVATTATDRWGLYRFDGLRIGRYRVRIAASNAPEPGIEWPERLVNLTDDFLFDQDLDLVDGAARALIEQPAATASAASPEPANAVSAEDPVNALVEPAHKAMAPEGAAPAEEPDHSFAGHILEIVTVRAAMPIPELVPLRHAGARARRLSEPTDGAEAIVVGRIPTHDLVPVEWLPAQRPARDLRAGASASGSPFPTPGEGPALPPRTSEPIARYWSTGARWWSSQPRRRCQRRTRRADDATKRPRDRRACGATLHRSAVRAARVPARQSAGHCSDRST